MILDGELLYTCNPMVSAFGVYWSIFLFSNVVISASMGFVLYLCQDLKPNV